MNPVKIPIEAFVVMAGPPDEREKLGPYMWVWGEGGKVHLVFRSMPWAKVLFDKKAVAQLIEALEKVDGESEPA
jgi:hypothetical protein